MICSIKKLEEEVIMKKIIVFVVAVCVAMTSFAGCAAFAADLDFTFGVAMRRYDDTFLTDERNAISATAKELGMPVDIVDSQASQTTQNDRIDIFLAKRYGAIGINLQELSAAAPLIEKCRAIGAGAIFFNNNPEDDVFFTYDKAYYIGARAEQSGIYQGEMMAKYFKDNPDKVPADGIIRYVMLTGDPGSQDMLLRTKHSVDTLSESFKVDCIGQEIGGWDRVRGQEKMAAFLAAHGDEINCVFANNDDMALGAIEALKASGYFQGKPGDPGYKFMPVVGVDATVPGVAALKEGTMLGTVLNDPIGQGGTTARVAYLIMKGEPVNEQTVGYPIDREKFIWIPYVKVTLDNVDQIRP